MTVPPDDLHRRIAAALARIERVTRSVGGKATQGAGLSALQARALEALAARPGRRVGELARELLVTDGTLSAALSSLESKALVVKRVDPDEHRAIIVELTARGRTKAKKLEAWPDDALAPVVRDLGVHGAGAVLAGLLALLEGMERRGWIDTTRMCLSCEFFRPWQGQLSGSGTRPHYCGLLEAAIGGADLQVDCPDFVAARRDVREERRERLRHPPS